MKLGARLGAATSFVYDVRGQVTAVTDAGGTTTTRAYDTFGRPRESTVPKDQDAGDIITTPTPVYDRNDNIVEATAPNGAVSQAVYDAADQLTDAFAPLDNPGDPERKTSPTTRWATWGPRPNPTAT